MIEIQNLSKKLGGQDILSDISFTVLKGEKVIILGQNGAGKTTLIRCILGEYYPTQGSVLIDGFSPIRKRVEALRHIAFVPQLPPPLKYTVKELFDYSANITGCDQHHFRKYCTMFDLDIDAHVHKPFFKLSGGMKQKVLISIAFARKSAIMIFDEPTANLDAQSRAFFKKLVSDASMKDKTFMFISHRTEEVEGVVSRSIELDFGKVIKDEKI